MQKFIIAVLISIFISFPSQAEVAKQIQILGNKRISDETIKIYGKIKNNKDYSERDLNKILNNLFSTNFFQDVKIELNNGILKIELVEYPVINNLIIKGEKSNKYVEEIKKVISTKNKSSFIKTNIAKDVELIKQLYASIGYNFVKVETKVNQKDASNIDIIFDINRGEITKISKITFTGDKKIREKRLIDITASEEDKFWKFISKNTKFSKNLVNLDIRLLKNYYKSLGYYDVNITSNSAEIKKTGNIELIYSIDAGKRYIIKKISTVVDPVFDKKLFFSLNEEYEKVIGDYYSPFKIKNLLEDIDDVIEKNNLQFVEHNVEEVIENDSIVVKFNIIEGKKILVERIDILGNNITNESVIRSELLLDEGDPFTSLRLDKSIAKIKSRNIFSNVESKLSEGSSPDLRNIEIKVEEKATGEISAGAGLGTNGGSVAFNIQENNWLGEGKRVGFDVEISNETVKGRINYTDPNYDYLGNSINYSLRSTSNDRPTQGYQNTILGAGVGTSFEQYKNLFVSLGLDLNYDDLKTDSTASDSMKKQNGSFSEVLGQYGFSYDLRNRTFQPTDGHIVSFNQSLPIYADKNIVTNTVSSSIYRTINENVIAANKYYIKSVTGLGGDKVRLSKRALLGSNRLRGFEKGKVGPVDGEDHIGGNYAAAINFEATLPNLLPESSKTDISLFLDVGNVWGVDYDSTLEDSSKIRSSTGAAASWVSPLGPMTFILSTNLSKASTDKTESFNFNLGTTF